MMKKIIAWVVLSVVALALIGAGLWVMVVTTTGTIVVGVTVGAVVLVVAIIWSILALTNPD